MATLLYPFVGWLLQGVLIKNAAVFFVLGVFFIFCGGYMSHRKIATRRGHFIALSVALATFYLFTMITVEGFNAMTLAAASTP